MRDKLEGRRPADMAGVDLTKGRTSALASAGGPLAMPIMALIAIMFVGAFVWMLADGRITLPKTPVHAPVPVADRHVKESNAGVIVSRKRRVDVHAEGYETSVMEKVVVAEYRPSARDGDETEDGDDSSRGRVHLIGRDGMEMRTYLPADCESGPIEARIGRVILVRADVWRLAGGGHDKRLSEDDASAALCGDFRGRDVSRKTQSTPEAAH